VKEVLARLCHLVLVAFVYVVAMLVMMTGFVSTAAMSVSILMEMEVDVSDVKAAKRLVEPARW
jgi:hypothetical protein